MTPLLLLRRRRLLAALASLPAAAWRPGARAAAGPIIIGFDAEASHKESTSDDAIRLGIRAALAEVNAEGGVLGRPLQLRELDNRSLPARGTENMAAFIQDPATVAVFGGKYSPVVLAMLPTAQAAGIPVLVPWSAADAITRGQNPNVAFRVGLTDSMAMASLARAARREGLRNLAFMAPRNAWGRSCADALQAVVQRELPDLGVPVRLWHNRGDRDFAEQIDEARRAGADAVLGVLNEAEGAGLVQAVAQRPPAERLPIFSHWGITGGDFPAMAGPALRDVSLAVVVTALPSQSRDPRVRRLLDPAAAELGLPSGARFTSAAGFLHAYDLTHLLALAIRRARSADRRAVLEALKGPLPFRGLVKSYERPFPPPQHEALKAEDLRLGMFDGQGVLVPYRALAPRRR